MRNNWVKSPAGTRAVVKTPKTRVNSHSLIGTIHSSALFHVVLKKPPPKSAAETAAKKKRKGNSGKKRAVAEVNDEEAARRLYLLELVTLVMMFALAIFIAFATIPNDKLMKYIGQRGIQAAVTSQALLSSNFKQQLSILLPPLMDTLISNDTLLNQTDGQTIDIRQSALDNDCINEHYIRSVAIHTLSILFNKLTGHYVRISLDLLFNYINENDKWCPPSLSISIMKIVKGSMQSQYKHLFISEILQQLNPNDIMSSKQASIVSILDITLNDDTPLLGVSVLEILNSLFNTLVKAAMYNAEDKQHSLEVQQHLIHSIGGLASHTYYENQLYDMASYLASKLKPYTTLDSVDHLPIYKYRCLVLACLDTIHHLPLESLKNGLGLLEDKDTKTRWLFCKSFYQHLKQQQHQQQPNTLLLNELLWTIHNWAQLPNLNLTDVRFIYAILCHLNHMMGMQATIMITSLVFKIQKYVQQDKDTSKQWVIESMIASWLKSTSRFYEIKPLEEYIDRLDQSSSHYPLELSEEANTESIENLPKLNRSKQPLWIDRSQVVEAISSDNKLREKHDVHGLELEAKLFIEWGSEGLVKHGTRLIQGSNNAKPKLSNPWEHGLLEKPRNEKRESIKVAMLKEALSTQPNDDSDSTTQASSNPSEHKPSLNALLTELKLPLNNPTISLVNPPYKS
ncbi:hypothetical protein G6F17_006102 [Rhizopus arrhizus]|nr:hypothetical protein G6F17_006102 [Rhizopus arrhizus]